MALRLPSTRNLLAFEAVARRLSVSEAALELSLTASAVSKQIQALESELGVSLLQRFNRGLALTPAGARYAREVRRLLEELGSVTDEIAGRSAQRLHVLVPSGYSANWLLPRLQGFAAQRPDLELVLTNYEGVDFDGDGVPRLGEIGADAAIVLGPGDWAWDWERHLLLPQPYLVPLCAPSLLPEGRPLDAPEALLEHTWLMHAGASQMWDYWKACAGLGDRQPRRKMMFSDGQAIISAAREGLGVMMSGGGGGSAPIGSGPDLVAAHSYHVLTGSYTYYLVYPPQGRRNAALQAFRRWIEPAA